MKAELLKLPPDRTAESIMTKPAKSIPVNVTVEEAKRRLEEIDHTAAPVVDSDDRVVGMMGNKNIRNAEKANSLGAPLKTYMNTKVILINASNTMREIEKIFLENKFNHMPVVNDDIKLVGIITRKDFLRAIHEEDELAELLQTR